MKSMPNIITFLLVTLAVFSTNAFAAQNFNGNSKIMLEKVLESSPFMFRNKIRSKLMNQLGKGSISEKDLIDAIKRTTPSIFLSKALDEARRYQS